MKPDFEFSSTDPNAALDYIHRRDGQTEIYFVANRSPRPVSGGLHLPRHRKAARAVGPDHGTGTARLGAVAVDGTGTALTLDFPPCGSLFVVFRPTTGTVSRHWEARIYPVSNRLKAEPQTLPGPWTVRFDPKWGGPGVVTFPQLVSWTQRPEEGIKFYSGTAVYETSFDLPESLREPQTGSRARSGQGQGIGRGPPQRQEPRRALGAALPRGRDRAPSSPPATSSKSRSSTSGPTASSATSPSRRKSGSPGPTFEADERHAPDRVRPAWPRHNRDYGQPVNKPIGRSDTQSRYVVVLEIPPDDSPMAAVQASTASGAQKKVL